MRTTARLLTSAALAAATIGIGAPAASAWGVESSLEVYPAIAAPGATVTVSTTACGRNGHGVGDATSLGAGAFPLYPRSFKDSVVGEFTIPGHTRQGTYAIAVDCRNGRTARGDVTVLGQHHGPRGHVRTGVGGSVGPDTTQIAAGVAVLAAAAVGGTLLLRRRASGAQDG